MSYDRNPSVYMLPEVDFSAALSTINIQVPAGFENGRIQNAGVIGTSVAFAADTTEPAIQVGDGTDADRYANVPIPDGLAIGSASSNRSVDPDLEGANGAAGEARIDASDLTDNQLVVTFTQAVDAGTAAGTGIPFVEINWF